MKDWEVTVRQEVFAKVKVAADSAIAAEREAIALLVAADPPAGVTVTSRLTQSWSPASEVRDVGGYA